MLRACERVHERSVGRLLLRIKLYHSVRPFVITWRARDRTRARSIALSFNYPLALSRFCRRRRCASAVNIPHLSSRANCCTTLRGPVAYHNERVRHIYLPIISGILSEAHKSILPAAPLLTTLSFFMFCFLSLSLFLLFLLLPTLLSRLLPRRSSTQRSQLKFITSSHG